LQLTLGLSTVAEWYAIVGLMAIFAAAPIPIAIMGVLLGAAKLVIASWFVSQLERNSSVDEDILYHILDHIDVLDINGYLWILVQGSLGSSRAIW